MVGSPRAYLCLHCIGAIQRRIAHGEVTTDINARCSFCGHGPASARNLVTGEQWAICDECCLSAEQALS